MPRTPTTEPSTDFARWLVSEMEARGWERKTLALVSGVGQSTISQIIGGIRKPSRDMVERLVISLAVPNTDDHTARARLSTGLVSAGFAPSDIVLEVEYAPILDELRSASYDGGLDSGDVDEISEIIRMKHRRKAERQGRA